jgi:6-phosphofructokinase 1
VAEGFHARHSALLADETVRADAFGHKKLGGAGRLVRKHVAARVAKDPDIAAAMKEHGVYVEGMNDAPEVREVIPGYLVRSGPATALDAICGMDLGIGAVHLLLRDLTGVTVTGIRDGVVQYVLAAEAIKGRLVDERMIAIYESLGICFGRKPKAFRPECVKADRAPWTYP